MGDYKSAGQWGKDTAAKRYAFGGLANQIGTPAGQPAPVPSNPIASPMAPAPGVPDPRFVPQAPQPMPPNALNGGVSNGLMGAGDPRQARLDRRDNRGVRHDNPAERSGAFKKGGRVSKKAEGGKVNLNAAGRPNGNVPPWPFKDDKENKAQMESRPENRKGGREVQPTDLYDKDQIKRIEGQFKAKGGKVKGC